MIDPRGHALLASLAAGSLLALAALAAGLPADAEPLAPTVVPMDGVMTINGVEAACTGIGQTRDDPRWTAYPVRIEFSNSKNEYLMGGVVEVSSAGKPLLTASCDGPWLLLTLPKGRYSAVARLLDVPDAKPRSAAFDAPASGQIRVVMQFLDQ
jgi:hypothetical protein